MFLKIKNMNNIATQTETASVESSNSDLNKKSIRGQEYKLLYETYKGYDFTKLDLSAQNIKVLGLHFSEKGYLCFSHFVGAMWINPQIDSEEKKIALIVNPKFGNLDEVKMFIDSVSSNTNKNELYEFYPDEDLIYEESVKNPSLFLIAAYLKELVHFCQKDLRMDFIQVKENLNGRIKGKVLIKENLRANLMYARPDRAMCKYELMSLDTLANRILKRALTLSIRFLAENNSLKVEYVSQLWNWANISNTALSNVSDVEINIRDFLDIHYSGLMQKYKRVHKLAKSIIKRFRLSNSGKVIVSGTVPFWINMNKLYEYYVGFLLNKHNGKGISFKPPEEITNDSRDNPNILENHNLDITIKPDFSSKNGEIIVDAKYKDIFESDKEKSNNSSKKNPERPSNQDIYQIMAYASLFYVINSDVTPKVVLLAEPYVCKDKSELDEILKYWPQILNYEKIDQFANEKMPKNFKYFKLNRSVTNPLIDPLIVGVIPVPLPLIEKIQ